MPRSSDPTVITPRLLTEWNLPEPKEGKRARGTVLVLGGSLPTPGAVLLAGTAALRSGAGRLQLGVAKEAATALSIAVPEAKVVGLPAIETGSVSGNIPEVLLALVSKADVVVVGPGLDDGEENTLLLRSVLEAIDESAHVVLDANALRALSATPELIEQCHERCVLTPNLEEASSLLNRDLGDDLDEEAVTVAQQYGTTVSLFGHVATPDGRCWREESADAGLGTSGSGDVAAGIVAGFLSRNALPEQAACWAAHVHAMAGRRLGRPIGGVGYMARELVDEIPATIASI
ncbi:MAG TPA: NAD(P)H-hydrate dehydratase [Aeromicrobium sp.]|nr:NAD(P)H-hydrate dehydratase [Aeromicrobium sp.]